MAVSRIVAGYEVAAGILVVTVEVVIQEGIVGPTNLEHLDISVVDHIFAMNKIPVIVDVGGGGGCVTSGIPGCAVAELMAKMSRTATNWRPRRFIVSIWV